MPKVKISIGKITAENLRYVLIGKYLSLVSIWYLDLLICTILEKSYWTIWKSTNYERKNKWYQKTTLKF